MPSPDDHWLDEEAGPVVRPYALTRGRTRPSGETLDLIAIITAVRGVQLDPATLDPEHIAVPAGGFADPSFYPPQRSVWESRKHAWVVVPADVIRDDEPPPDGAG